MMKKVLILAPYPLDEAPSQRFRFEHFLKFMEDKGLTYDFRPFLSTNTWKILYQPGQSTQKTLGILSAYFGRIMLLFSIGQYDAVLIHRESAPLGPPIIEFIIARVWRKKIIYDFDDAIWLNDPNGESLIFKWLKWRSKVKLICSWSWKVTTGNDYLATYARKYCRQVEILPTMVDTTIHQVSKTGAPNQLTIGWTGSHSTLHYLNPILPVLRDLQNDYDFNFLVIANKDPQLPLKNYQFVRWSKTTEVQDLQQIDIGIMPLEDNDWSRGKCGFKLIQYLSLGIPAVASPVGVNSEIVIEEQTGLLATTQEEWTKALVRLLESPDLRKSYGMAGRKLIGEHYSVKSQKETFLRFFQE